LQAAFSNSFCTKLIFFFVWVKIKLERKTKYDNFIFCRHKRKKGCACRGLDNDFDDVRKKGWDFSSLF